MEITTSTPHGIHLLTVSGKLDSNQASEFDTRLRETIAEDSGQPVILDFSGVQTLTSAPLRAILSLAKRMQRYQSQLFLAAPSENALESLRISGFLKLKIFELTDTLDTALKLAQQASSTEKVATSPSKDARPAAVPSLPVFPLPTPCAPTPIPAPPVPALPPPHLLSPLSAALSPPPPPALSPRPKIPLPLSAALPPPITPPPVTAAPPVASIPSTTPPLAILPITAPPIQPPLAVAAPLETEPPSPPLPVPFENPTMEPVILLSEAKSSASLVGWFNRWAWEVQNALDYWVRVFRKKQ